MESRRVLTHPLMVTWASADPADALPPRTSRQVKVDDVEDMSKPCRNSWMIGRCYRVETGSPGYTGALGVTDRCNFDSRAPHDAGFGGFKSPIWLCHETGDRR